MKIILPPTFNLLNPVVLTNIRNLWKKRKLSLYIDDQKFLKFSTVMSKGQKLMFVEPSGNAQTFIIRHQWCGEWKTITVIYYHASRLCLFSYCRLVAYFFQTVLSLNFNLFYAAKIDVIIHSSQHRSTFIWFIIFFIRPNHSSE